MIESRMFPRMEKNIDCLFNISPSKLPEKRIVLNISQGGMLLEKNNNDNLEIGSLISITLISDNKNITLDGIILRIQERSIAIKFSFKNIKEEEKLKSIIN